MCDGGGTLAVVVDLRVTTFESIYERAARLRPEMMKIRGDWKHRRNGGAVEIATFLFLHKRGAINKPSK